MIVKNVGVEQPQYWWLGKTLHCDECNAEYELEASDANGRKFVWWITDVFMGLPIFGKTREASTQCTTPRCRGHLQYSDIVSYKEYKNRKWAE